MHRILQLCLSIAMLIGGVSLASAEVPSPGQVIPVYGTILCDEKQNIIDIVAAGSESFDPAAAKYIELFKARNDRGEPICLYNHWANIQVISIEPLPVLVYPSGPVMTWVIEAESKNPAIPNCYILWTEKTDDEIKPSSTLPPSGRAGSYRYIINDRPEWTIWDFLI